MLLYTSKSDKTHRTYLYGYTFFERLSSLLLGAHGRENIAASVRRLLDCLDDSAFFLYDSGVSRIFVRQLVAEKAT